MFFVGGGAPGSVKAHCPGELDVMIAGGSEAPLTFGR